MPTDQLRPETLATPHTQVHRWIQGYARRKPIVEPVFGQGATLQGKHVLLRGLDNARGEWKLLAACHNLRKLHGHIGTAGLGNLRPAI